MRLRDDSDERHSRRFGGARVVHRVADEPEFSSGLHALDGEQTVRRGLALCDMLRADDRIEAEVADETLQSDVELILQAAGENRQAETLTQPLEEAGFW